MTSMRLLFCRSANSRPAVVGQVTAALSRPLRSGGVTVLIHVQHVMLIRPDRGANETRTSRRSKAVCQRPTAHKANPAQSARSVSPPAVRLCLYRDAALWPSQTKATICSSSVVPSRGRDERCKEST